MVLLIDNYDSSVSSVVQYLNEPTNEEMKTTRNNALTLAEMRALQPTRIMLSPGSKHPKDSSICLETLREITDIPILGICLGHQTFGLVRGATIAHPETPLYGKASEVEVVGKEATLSKGLPSCFDVMCCHSLYMDKDTLPEELKITALSDDGVIMAL